MDILMSDLSKYILILLILLYTWHCFTIFAHKSAKKRRHNLSRQRGLIYLLHLLAFTIIFIHEMSLVVIGFYIAQVVFLILTMWLYSFFYPKASTLVINNMCMLLVVGFIILSRLDIQTSIKQFVILCVGMVISLFIPVIIRKLKILENLTWVYCGLGLLLLLIVLIKSNLTYGANIVLQIGPVTIQPSEFVKIIYVFFIAAALAKSIAFRDIVITSVFAAAYCLVLVLSTDLGACLTFFVTYVLMLYAASKQWIYLVAGFGGGGIASILAHQLFAHVKTRVSAWRDPFADYYNGGNQLALSLLAISSGSWFGLGLYQGIPEAIPVVKQDFIISAIAEEMGIIFAIAVILICMSNFIMFMNIALQIRKLFYKYIALGLGIIYGVQVILTVGGAIKFIPSTGVTLPLISAGGSSILSTVLTFAIIQGLYIIREDEDDEIEARKKEQKIEEALNRQLQEELFSQF